MYPKEYFEISFGDERVASQICVWFYNIKDENTGAFREMSWLQLEEILQIMQREGMKQWLIIFLITSNIRTSVCISTNSLEQSVNSWKFSQRPS